MPPGEMDRRAAEALILEHLPDVTTLCTRMFRQPGDAQDATHEAVVAILRSLPAYRGDGPIRHWLLKVALNAARSHHRKLRRTSGREASLEGEFMARSDASDPVAADDQAQVLHAALTTLPEPVRATVILRYFHRLTQSEIGRCLGCSQKTVHVRLAKGLDLLGRRLARHGAAGAVLPATALARAGLDPVTAEQVARAKRWIAAYDAASNAASGAGGAAKSATGSALSAEGAIAGGSAMNLKLLAGCALVAAVSFLGGAVFSDALVESPPPGSGGGGEVGAPRPLTSDRATAGPGRVEGSGERGHPTRGVGRERGPVRELRALRAELDARDAVIASLRGELQELAAAADDPDADVREEERRRHRWERIRQVLEPVLEVALKMDEDAEQQLPLGDHLIAQLCEVTTEQFEEIVAFDATTSDPEQLQPIRAFMTQALIHAPNAAPVRSAYMSRLLDRVYAGTYGDVFTERALHRLSFSNAGSLNLHERLIAPLDEELRGRFVALAAHRLQVGPTEPLQVDGARFLSRAPERAATDALIRAFREDSSDAWIRLAALDGLSARAADDGYVQRFLRDARPTEPQTEIRAKLTEVLDALDGRAGPR